MSHHGFHTARHAPSTGSYGVQRVHRWDRIKRSKNLARWARKSTDRDFPKVLKRL